MRLAWGPTAEPGATSSPSCRPLAARPEPRAPSRSMPAVAADADLIAAAGPAGPVGDNATARDIAALQACAGVRRHRRRLRETWGQLVYRVGRDTQVRQGRARKPQDIVRQVDELRDQVSGVSLDEEAMQLMRFQRAYEANARFFRAMDMTLDTLMQTLAR